MAGVVLYGPNGQALNPSTGLIVDPTFYAARISSRPSEYAFLGTAYGHYKMAFTFSSTAAIAAAPLVSLRWSPTTNVFFILHRIRWTHAILTTVFTTQQLVDVAVTRATGWTGSDTGGTQMLVASGSQKARTTMGNSLLSSISPTADFRNASGSAIVAGTRTLDANPFAQAAADIASNTAATGGTPLITSPKDVYAHVPGGEHPEVFAQNEGLVINCPQSLAAAGVVKWGFIFEWFEALQY